MKINNNIIYKPKQSTQPQFKGKGIDLLDNWMQERSEHAIRFRWYDDICRDLTEGAKSYFENNKDIDNSVINLHKNDGLSMLFDIPNNEVVKVSLENPLEFRKHRPEFDIPFLSPVEQYGKTYIVRQPKADTENITHEHFRDVVKRIYSHGCELSKDGYRYEQYGLYNGKAYLIDTRCAMPMPSIYTMLIDKICGKINKCYIYITKEQGETEKAEGLKEKGYFYYHADETPRKSVNFKGGLIKLFNTIRNNIKYRKNHYCIPYEESRRLQYKIRRYYKM